MDVDALYPSAYFPWGEALNPGPFDPDCAPVWFSFSNLSQGFVPKRVTWLILVLGYILVLKPSCRPFLSHRALTNCDPWVVNRIVT